MQKYLVTKGLCVVSNVTLYLSFRWKAIANSVDEELDNAQVV